jgi:hypothetical protein
VLAIAREGGGADSVDLESLRRITANCREEFLPGAWDVREDCQDCTLPRTGGARSAISQLSPLLRRG